MAFNLKKFGMLELLVILSAIYVLGMLIWTASTRPAVEARAKQVTENHKKVVDLINNEVNRCSSAEEGTLTVWGDTCNGEWISENVIKYINKCFFDFVHVIASSEISVSPLNSNTSRFLNEERARSS